MTLGCILLAAAVGLSSGTLSVEFRPENGRLAALTAAGRNYVSTRNDQCPLWQVDACKAGDFARLVTVASDQAKAFRVERGDGALTLVWEDVGASVAKAVAVFRAEPSDGSLRCRLTVTPKPGWALVETQFPRFAMNECLGTTPTDDAIVMGTGHGGLVRYPMDPRREYWKSRHVGHSPGNLVAQFGSFFDDAGGLYTAAEDAEGNEKELLMDRWWRLTLADGSYGGGEFLFRWSRFEYSETTDAQPYDIVLRAFKGREGEPTTWYDAADIYKVWAERQFWCKRKFLEKTDFLPDWTRDAPVVMRFNRAWFDKPEFMRKWLRDYWCAKFPGAPLLAILEGWEHHGDWITTEYFPVYPSEERFAEMMGWVKAAGGYFWPWPGGHHWNVQVGKKPDGTFRLDFSKDFWERVAPHAVVNPDGKVRLDDLVWLGGGNSASICTADPWGVDWWNRDVSVELVRRGAELVQADQDVGARVPVCWSTRHGHKPGPGKWRLASQRRQFETMLAEMRKVNPRAMFSFEEMHEFFNDIYAFCDYRNCRWPGPEWASVWNYLYHEYVPPFQSGAEQYGKWFWMTFCAVDGQMPRLPVDPDWYFDEGALLDNGGFEERVSPDGGFVGWEKPQGHVVSADCREGRHALQVGDGGTNRVQVARNLPVEALRPGATYRFTCSLKTLKENRRNSAHFSALVCEDGRYKSLGGVSFDMPRPAEGWKTQVAEFTMPPNAGMFRMMFDAFDGGVFLVDGLKLEERRPDGSYAVAMRSSGNREMLSFVERWIRLYRGEGRKYLAHGKELHPPTVECDRVPYHENFRGTVIDNVKPAVFASAWEAADGSRALCFGNATGVDRKVAYRWNGVWTKLTLRPHELKLVPDAPARPPKKVECVAVYYPHWHAYPKGDEWFHPGWTEWEFVKTAKPRFRGAKQPMVPYAGYLDESDPKDMEKDIALAANAGIDVFLYDYYYYDGEVTQEKALEEGFLKAKNRDRLKFALMWCYHERRDQFRPKSGEERRRLMSLAHTPEEFLGFVDLCVERYFRRPEYWRKDGKLFLSIYAGPYLIDTLGGVANVRKAVDEARARVRAAGLGELHLNVQQMPPGRVREAEPCGFDSVTTYGFCPWHLPDWKERMARGEREIDYAEIREPLYGYWKAMREVSPLPYFPVVSTGWDSTPRCRPDEPYPWKRCDYPYTMSFANNTPDLFREYLAEARRTAEQDPKQPGVVYVNGWNEYTEGTYLVPNNFDSDLFLRAVASVFGRSPADEYTYVNPSTKELLTVPAATRESVAYGPHPKQKVDLFLPGGEGPFPTVVYLHGGGWGGGAMVDHILGRSIRALLGRGVAVVAVGYRYVQETDRDGRPPVQGCLDDCERAVRFVKERAGEWRLDVGRLALAGGSAGACTALYLALKDGNALGVAAVAPIIAQTSMDPREMREWIPNSTYGAHAFGYRGFADWLAHRADCLADIERISPAALARRIDPAKAPRVFLQYGAPVKPGELAKDPTHSAVFGERFKAICEGRGIGCDIGYGGRPAFGDVFVRLADFLTRPRP